MTSLTLVSHHLCPYVQRAAIALMEKDVEFERVYIDLADKPDWFKAISPLGKVPLLQLGGADGPVVFESAVIVEYLEDTQAQPLHPMDALLRARHRGWIEFASSILNDIAGLYNAPDRDSFEKKADVLKAKLVRLEGELSDGPYFSGDALCLVDAAFAPVFRYFDTFESAGALQIFGNLPKLSGWRRALAGRASVVAAAPADYPQRLEAFLLKRGSFISSFYA